MCSSCLKAPLNDLSIYNKLLRYKRVDKEVAHAALSTMRRHMAYMKPETVVLRLASKSVNAKEKTAMAQSLLASHGDAMTRRRMSFSSTRTLNLQTYLVQESSWLVFRLIRNAATNWLQDMERRPVREGF